MTILDFWDSVLNWASFFTTDPCSLAGGVGAVRIRAKKEAGEAKLTAIHPQLGPHAVTFRITEAAPQNNLVSMRFSHLTLQSAFVCCVFIGGVLPIHR